MQMHKQVLELLVPITQSVARLEQRIVKVERGTKEQAEQLAGVTTYITRHSVRRPGAWSVECVAATTGYLKTSWSPVRGQKFRFLWKME